MDLKTLVKLTPAVVQKASVYTAIKDAKITVLKSGCRKIAAVAKRKTPDRAKHGKHVVTVECKLPEQTKFSVGDVKVSCSCEAFTYFGIEYLLHKKKAADIKYSNGKAPNIRNPRGIIFLCPHLTKLAMLLIDRKM